MRGENKNEDKRKTENKGRNYCFGWHKSWLVCAEKYRVPKAEMGGDTRLGD